MIASRSDRKPGSSPLARGLPVRIAPVQSAPRIIPARAGFTPATPTTCPSAPDHPRSRGVYSTTMRIGLGRSWIIPARAGFTRPVQSGRTGGRDHPRSRGVYGECVVYFTLTLGSSPLARGLPKMKSATYSTDRIIPARAGFTYSKPRTAFVVKDHPRSRGVYEHDIKEMGDAEGSSPLARGLRA